jgi:hypothetical protein
MNDEYDKQSGIDQKNHKVKNEQYEVSDNSEVNDNSKSRITPGRGREFSIYYHQSTTGRGNILMMMIKMIKA